MTAFTTDRCPVCNLNLQMEIKTPNPNKVVFKYYCSANYSDDNNKNNFVNFHYTNEIWHDMKLSQILIGNYLLKNWHPLNITVIVDVNPKSDKSLKTIAEVPLLELDYSNLSEAIVLIKKIILFS